MIKTFRPSFNKRKITNKQKNKVNENLAKRVSKLYKEKNVLEATVISHMGYNVIVQTDINSPLFTCNWRNNIKTICVGDRVLISNLTNSIENKDFIIEAVLPRKNIIEKVNHHRGIKPVIANIDQILLIITHYPMLHPSFIDRALIIANMINTNCLVYFNKIDVLTIKNDINRINYLYDIYKKIPKIEWLFGSTKTKQGLDILKAKIDKHKITMVIGQSGVGKSTLINTLIPDISIQTNDISQISALGQHTTTNSTLYYLDKSNINSSILIDMPGFRSFDYYFKSDAIAPGFTEIYPFIGQCQFSNCLHNNETNCAIKNAVKSGYISQLRYNSFLKILTEK